MSTSARGTGRVTPAKCSSCHRPLDSPLFCSDCHTLHPAEGWTYFEMLGFEPVYDVDAAELRRRYLQCSRVIHPDRHGGTDGEEARLALRNSARLNEAQRVLGDAVLRAEYLLELLGGPSSATDKTVPPDVLNRTLMLREEMEEARAEGNQGVIEAQRQQVRQLCDNTVREIAALARQLPGTERVRRQLRQTLNAIKYYQKLLDRT